MYKPLARTYSHAATSCREVWKMQWMMSDPCPAKNKGMKGIKLLTASALSWSFLDCKHEDKDLVNLRTPPPHILGACLACFQHTADDPEILLDEWMGGYEWMSESSMGSRDRTHSFQIGGGDGGDQEGVILKVWSQLGWKELTHFPWRSRLWIAQPGKWWEQGPRKGKAQERNRRQKDMVTWRNVRKYWKCRPSRDCMRTSGRITSQLSNHWGLWWCGHSTQGIFSGQSRTTGMKSP